MIKYDFYFVDEVSLLVDDVYIIFMNVKVFVCFYIFFLNLFN